MMQEVSSRSPRNPSKSLHDDPYVTVAVDVQQCPFVEMRTPLKTSTYKDRLEKAKRGPAIKAAKMNSKIISAQMAGPMKDDQQARDCSTVDKAIAKKPAQYNARVVQTFVEMTVATVEHRGEADVADSKSTQVIDNNIAARDAPPERPLSQRNAVSIIEKKKRIMQYKDHLKKKLSIIEHHEDQLQDMGPVAKSLTGQTVSSSSTGPETLDEEPCYLLESDQISIDANEITPSCSLSSAERSLSSHAGTKNATRPVSPTRESVGETTTTSSTPNSVGRLNGLPRPELPKHLPTLSREHETAPKLMSIYDSPSVVDSFRQSSQNDKRAPSPDILMVYNPKNSHSQRKAATRNSDTFKKESTSSKFYAKDGNDKAQHLAYPPEDAAEDEWYQCDGLRVLSEEIKEKETHKSHRRLDRKDQGHDYKRNYTSFVAAVGEITKKTINLTALPSPQNRVFKDAESALSSLFTALMETDSVVKRPDGTMNCEGTGDEPDDADSLFSFLSKDSLLKPSQSFKSPLAFKVVQSVAHLDPADGIDGCLSEDSLYADLDQQDDEVIEPDTLPDTVSTRLSDVMETPDILEPRNIELADDCDSSAPSCLPDELEHGQAPSSPLVCKRKKQDKDEKKTIQRRIVPFFFRSKKSHKSAVTVTKQDQEPEMNHEPSSASPRDAPATDPGMSLVAMRSTMPQLASSDEDERTMATVFDGSDSVAGNREVEVKNVPMNTDIVESPKEQITSALHNHATSANSSGTTPKLFRSRAPKISTQSFPKEEPEVVQVSVSPGHHKDQGNQTFSIEVVPLADGSTYISTSSTLHDTTTHAIDCPPIEVKGPEKYNELESGSNKPKTAALPSTRSPSTGGELELALAPPKPKRSLFGILRSARASQRDPGPDSVIVGEISSPRFRVEVHTPLAGVFPGGSPKLRKRSSTKQSVQVENMFFVADQDEDNALKSIGSGDDQSLGVNTRATYYSQSSQKSTAVDKVAHWILQSFKEIIGNPSSDSDEQDRQTTFSQSTGYDAESHAYSQSDFSAMATEERPNRAPRGIPMTITAMSHGTTDDLKKVLEMAKKLNMKPKELIERIEAGGSIPLFTVSK
jgi:hypothetical protein